MIGLYDLEDNLIYMFESTKECAKYFETTQDVINCYLSRRKLHTPLKRKRDFKNNRWVILVRIDEDE